MLTIYSVRNVALQPGDGRNLRYALQPIDVYDNDPFIIMADDKFAHNTFADHPHKGIQTVTYVLEGSLTHYDSQTGGGRLNAGDFQIMTAGSGIIHNENPDRDEEVRVLQLWVNLSSEHKKLPGQYEDLLKAHVPIVSFEGGQIEVLAGEVAGVASPLTLFTPFQYAAVTIEDGHYSFPIAAGYNTYLYVLEGQPTVNGQLLNPFDMVHFEVNEHADTIELAANAQTKFVIFSGQPIKEPIVAQGPFVMNTQQEIQEAFLSYRNGTFLNGTPY